MGNWVSRPGTEGGWETVWDESAPASPTQPTTPAAINYKLTGPAPSDYRASSLGDYVVNEYLRSLEFTDQLGNTAMRESPYVSGLNPGGGGMSEDQKRALYYGMMSANDPVLASIINGVQNGGGGAYIPEGFDYNNNIYLAPRVGDDGDFGDIMKFFAIAGGLSGIGNALYGGLGSGAGAATGLADVGAYGGFGDLAAMGGAEALGSAGTAGLDAITAADMAAGDAMLSGMGQDYTSFLSDLTNGTVAGTANLDTVLPTQGTTVPTGQAATTTLPPGGGTLANVVGAGDIEDAQLGADILKNSGQTYQQFLDALKTGVGAYQFPWANVIGSIMEAYGQDNYRNDLLDVMNKAITESDPFRTQRPRYFEPLYQAATQGVGGTPYGEAIANSTLRKLSSTGDAGYDITGLGANTLAKNLNSASLDYVKALTPLTGAGFQANTSAATTAGQQAAQAGMGGSGSLGSAFSSIMTGNQPSSLERLFGGKQANQTFPQFLSSF